MPSKKLDATEMTVKQFANELRRTREKALRIRPSKGQANRPKAPQKRGDFYGKR